MNLKKKISDLVRFTIRGSLMSFVAFFLSLNETLLNDAVALELDWSGQFSAEYNFIHNYSMDNSGIGAGVDSSRNGKGGYYIPGGGSHDANFQNLFLRLRPKVIVNDNIFIKTEVWFGDPIFGIFGNSVPYSTDQRQYYSNQSRGSIVRAQRYWAEFLSDIGTFQVGRVPLQWGLGVIWNSGDNLWDRYLSTGDAIRWIAKFGSFSLIPSFIVESTGNTIGGSCFVNGPGLSTTCSPSIGMGGVTDYSVIFKYENTDDELEAGINLLKRLGGASQDPASGILTPGQGREVTGSMNYITYDLFARKRFSHFGIAAEVPVTSGSVATADYATFGVAVEMDWKPNEVWDILLKTGYAPGQANSGDGTLSSYNAYYFNPNYHIAMIMFNYQLANFAGPQTLNNPNLSPTALSSPYDNPIVNAQYLALNPHFKPWDKWTFRPNLVYALAPKTAQSGQYFYNYWTRSVQLNNTGSNQVSSLGLEFDLGVTFQWDEYFQFAIDTGIFFPGQFYAFSNTPTNNATNPVFATSLRVGVNF